jgi:hypothetical protein
MAVVVELAIACNTEKPTGSANGTPRTAIIPPVKIIRQPKRAETPEAIPAWKKRYPSATLTEVIQGDIAVVHDADGTEYFLPADEGMIDGATSFAEMMLLESELYAKMNEPYESGTANADFAVCGAALRQRRGPIPTSHKWVMGAHWIGDGRSIHIAEIVVDESLWPEHFDDEAKECWLAVLSKFNVPSEQKLDRVVEMKFCVTPS